MSIQPLQLAARIQPLKADVAIVPFLDFLFVAALLALSASTYIFPPGVTVDLPTLDPAPAGMPAQAVMTVRAGHLLLFEGELVPPEEVAAHLGAYLEERRWRDPVLLLKVDRAVDVQELLRLCSDARAAGFARVQIAAEAAPAAAMPFSRALP